MSGKRELENFLEKIEEIDRKIREFEQNETSSIKQAPLIQNCTLKRHQLRGLSWLITLDKCNCNGILGDDMGLGK
jgi:SNF2 family DNA or RNA helicase